MAVISISKFHSGYSARGRFKSAFLYTLSAAGIMLLSLALCFSPLSASFGDMLHSISLSRLGGGRDERTSIYSLMNTALFAGRGAMQIGSGQPPRYPYQFFYESLRSFESDDSYTSAAGGHDIYPDASAATDRGGVTEVIIEEAVQEDRYVPEGWFPVTQRNLSHQRNGVIRLLTINQTRFAVDLDEIKKQPFPIKTGDLSDDKPIVLILCTHATESYREDGSLNAYTPAFTGPRSDDPNQSVVLIATELARTLREHGIPTVQSFEMHDKESFGSSYARALETINAYMKKYPSIRYIIDVHRDSIITNSGEKYNPLISVNGRNAAQVMLVVGTSEGGAAHPNWQDNLTFAVHLQYTMNRKYPMLARPINLRAQRFNQHAAPGAVIVEVGSCGSTFEEALYTARLFGECLAELILSN